MKKSYCLFKAICLVVCLMMFNSSWASVTLPQKLNLVYTFKLASIPLGVIEKRLRLDNGQYTADSIIKPNAAAALLYSGEIDEKSVFKIKDNRLMSLSFHAVRNSADPYDRKAVFDHEAKTVLYNSGKSEKLKANTVDLGSFIFAIMLEDLSTIENKVYQINTGDKYRAYRALKPEMEEITTPAGTFNTTKITLKRDDRNNRFYYVWLDNTSRYPVKITRDKKGKKSTLELKSATP